jgi:outer membrane protein assembly factor BamB
VLASLGLVVVNTQKAVNVIDAATGNTLFEYQDTGPSAYFFSAPALSHGMLYAANADGNLYAFGL